MGMRAVREYYLQVQAQYLEMVNDAKDFDDALKAGVVEQAQFDQAQVMLAKIKENYERLSYIMYLFMQPNRKEKVAKFNRQNKLISNHFSSGDGVLKENGDLLIEFKKLIKEIKKQYEH